MSVSLKRGVQKIRFPISCFCDIGILPKRGVCFLCVQFQHFCEITKVSFANEHEQFMKMMVSLKRGAHFASRAPPWVVRRNGIHDAIWRPSMKDRPNRPSSK